jgi:uncharacterized membrane protein YfcA
MSFVLLGLAVGIMSGILGLGGGIFLVPALIYLFKFSPYQAQGTSLGVLIPPIGLFAALEYYRRGYIDFGIVGLICLGFVFGAFLGAFFVAYIPVPLMRRLFGLFLFFVSLQMVFATGDRHYAAIFPTVAATALLGLLYILERRLGLALPRLRRYVERYRPNPPRIEYQI